MLHWETPTLEPSWYSFFCIAPSIPFNFQSLCSVYSLLFFPCRALYEESSVLTADCCKSQVHFENTEQYDQHHEKWGDHKYVRTSLQCSWRSVKQRDEWDINLLEKLGLFAVLERSGCSSLSWLLSHFHGFNYPWRIYSTNTWGKSA